MSATEARPPRRGGFLSARSAIQPLIVPGVSATGFRSKAKARLVKARPAKARRPSNPASLLKVLGVNGLVKGDITGDIAAVVFLATDRSKACRGK